MLGEGQTFVINGSFGLAEEKVSINSSKADTKFCSSLHYNADDGYFFVHCKEIISLKLIIKMLTFQLHSVSEAYLMDLVLWSLEKYL